MHFTCAYSISLLLPNIAIDWTIRAPIKRQMNQPTFRHKREQGQVDDPSNIKKLKYNYSQEEREGGGEGGWPLPVVPLWSEIYLRPQPFTFDLGPTWGSLQLLTCAIHPGPCSWRKFTSRNLPLPPPISVGRPPVSTTFRLPPCRTGSWNMNCHSSRVSTGRIFST